MTDSIFVGMGIVIGVVAIIAFVLGTWWEYQEWQGAKLSFEQDFLGDLAATVWFIILFLLVSHIVGHIAVEVVGI